MYLKFIKKGLIMNIITHLEYDDLNTITDDQCRHCNQVFLIKDADPNYDGIVSTYDNERYCTFSCVTEKKK
ncbi:hypothetical protein C9E89_010400 [Acinetobacter sichuanensis]|uniref:Uncharacterized protein n=2 Tax=Acinetobacter sichuanensis TaxID=2136183 RepID=A0A371YQ23_9GAMM|nr:hypothetical protein C9E89_010400 [Acinetobacter sichuanensis]